MEDSNRLLRIAAWIWLGFLFGMGLLDFTLYTPQVQMLFLQSRPPGGLPAPLAPLPLLPVYTYYLINGALALLFHFFANWAWVQKKLGKIFYPLMVLAISAGPIMLNVLFAPRFPQGPLSNAEGMALRQIPILLVALVLVAWEYRLWHVIVFSAAITLLELWLIGYASVFEYRNLVVFVFIGLIRMISFIAVGIFLNILVVQLRQQQKDLQQANTDLTHYASTLEHLAVSRERNRLARELHDTLAHSLTAISVSLETARAYFDVDVDKSRDLLDKSLLATRTGVDETRRALRALRSSSLEDLGLGLAIRKLAESAAQRAGLQLDILLDQDAPSLSPDVEQAIYRIAQEALQNVANHAGAKSVILRLTYQPKVMLAIQDDGVGFEPGSLEKTGHYGLLGMHERARLVGGSLLVESTKGHGTRLVLTI